MRTKSRLLFFILSPLLTWASPILADGQFLPKNHPKHQTTQIVLDDLVQAIGDGRTKPSVRLLPKVVASDMKVAWYEHGQHRITLEERTYDLLAELGPDSLDALAFLLGHELAHYYQGHGWVGDFRHAFVDVEMAKKLLSLAPGQFGSIRTLLDQKELENMEIQADYFGGFYGYLAGYNTLDIAPKVLEKIYREYKVKEDTLGYPSLTERQQATRKSMASLQRLLPVFNAATSLLLLKLHKEAARCFDYIARSFPSREILNNAGLARALEALSLIEPERSRLVYPFEIDAESRLDRANKAAAFDASETMDELTSQEAIDALLHEARAWLEKARQRDPDYATTYINLACVADLQREYDEAHFFAGQGLKIARRNGAKIPLANALIARAIVRSHIDPSDDNGPLQDITQALEGNEPLATLNLARLGAAPEPTLPKPEKRSDQAEMIGGLRVLDTDTLSATAQTMALLPSQDALQTARIYGHNAATWYGLTVELGYSTVILLHAREGYIGTTGRDIRIGSTMQEVRHAYGDPAYLVAGRQGTYHVYQQNQIVFHSNADNKVSGWMLYGIEE